METRPTDARSLETSAADRAFAEFRESGDPLALGEVYDLLAPELLRVALHLVPQPAEAEDVLQATFVTAIENAARFDPAQRVMPWFVGILGNEARRARARLHRRPDPGRLEGKASASPALDAEHKELLERLDASLERVPEAFRPVLALKLRHGLTVTEIAAALGRPSGTVRSQLARGAELLRRTLPAGLAGALALLVTPTRGLAAVRDAVVDHATRFAPWSLPTTVAGALAVKKLVALAALLVAALSLWSVARSPEAPRTTSGAVEPATELASDRSGDALAAPIVAESARIQLEEPAPGRAAEPAATSLERPRAGSAELVVRAHWPDGARAESEIVLVTPPTSLNQDDTLVARTDGDGVARFPELAPGSAYVRLLRGGEDQVTLLAGKTRTVELSIHGGVTVEGTVVDGRGAALAGAEIWVSERYRTNIGHVVARCDEHGRFEVRCVSPDHYLGARLPGFAPSSLRNLRGGSGDRVRLELRLEQVAAALRGRVIDQTGEPIAGAQILVGEELPAFSVRLDDGSFAPAAPPQRAMSDEDGRYAVDCVPLGLAEVQARAIGCAPFAASIEILANGRNELEVRLARSARVTGTVHGAHGKPVGGVSIRDGQIDRFASSSTWSGLDGSFLLDGLAPGRRTLTAHHRDEGGARAELLLAAGETTTWDVALRGDIGIEGRLSDARGQPLAGFVVVALPDSDPDRRSRSGQSDADGRFAIGELEDEPHVLRVQRPRGWREFPLLELEDVWPSAASLELSVPDVARDFARIRGEFVDPSGAPVVGAELQLWHMDEAQWRSFAAEGEKASVDTGAVPPGTVQLDVRHPEHPWKHLGSFPLRAGETLDLGRVAFEPSGRLRARLSGIPDELLAGVTAMLASEANRESGMARICGGELTTGPLAPGRHTLVVSGDFVREEELEIEIRPGVEEEREIELERCGLREVVLQLPAGAPAPRWIALSLNGENGALVWRGRADCERTPPMVRVSAPPGTYRLWAGSEELSATGEFTLSRLDGSEPPLVLPLALR